MSNNKTLRSNESKLSKKFIKEFSEDWDKTTAFINAHTTAEQRKNIILVIK